MRSIKMMDLDTIRKVNQRKAQESKKLGKLPFTVAKESDKNLLPQIAHIGDYRPKGFKLVNEYFVDKTGFGSINEPALTIEQFKRKVKKGHSYAIIEEGQFQVYVGEFRRSFWQRRKEKKLRKKLEKIEAGIRFFQQEKQMVEKDFAVNNGQQQQKSDFVNEIKQQMESG